eukprot:UN22072
MNTSFTIQFLTIKYAWNIDEIRKYTFAIDNMIFLKNVHILVRKSNDFLKEKL